MGNIQNIQTIIRPYIIVLQLHNFSLLNCVVLIFKSLHAVMVLKNISPGCGVWASLMLFKRPARDACLCMGELQAPAAPPAPHFVFLITL